MTEARSWSLDIPGELLTHNKERASHWSVRSRIAKQWRTDAHWLTIGARIPHLERCSFDIRIEQSRGRLADTGAHEPVAKAAIDGLVDAGVLDDDTGAHVTGITFHPPTRPADKIDRLILTITEA